MGARAGLLVGIVAGAIFATTPQGRKIISDVRGKAMDAWGQPTVQRRVSDVQAQVRKNVPVVGDDIADAIGRTRPQGSSSAAS